MDTNAVLDYESLVYSIINKYSNYASLDDLYQVGMVGLLEACKNYKESHDAKFSTYAYLYIMGEVTKYIRENKSVKISRDTIKLYKTIEKARDFLRQKYSREVSDRELSLFLEIDINTISKVNDAMMSVQSLDNLTSIDDERSYYNSVKVYDKKTSSDILDLKDAINELDDEDKRIIYDRYYNGYTQSEISNSLGISQVQVSRKENKILEKLKVKL